MTAAKPIRDYAKEQLNNLLNRLAFEVHRAAKQPGPDEIHELRVSIRRFSQGLAVFHDFVPAWEVKKVEKRLKRMMRLTSQIRDRDITLEFLGEAKHTTHLRRFTHERSIYQREFSEMVRRWSSRDFSAKWRNGLSLRGV
ncbi:MAG TPA: CHAD domain-containing protein [Bryobacteraceae bacterium]|jgi:CHAD domain-containing protein|nr:CHAD domain-containing protein [Bryobacteraceae bacterium]